MSRLLMLPTKHCADVLFKLAAARRCLDYSVELPCQLQATTAASLQQQACCVSLCTLSWMTTVYVVREGLCRL